MKRTILQKAAAAALFVLLTAALLAAADFLLVDDVHSYSRVMLQELYDDAENIDTLFLGSSHCYRSVDPAQVDAALGTHSFNAGSSQQLPDGSYYILKEAAAQNPLKTVYLEMFYTGYNESASANIPLACYLLAEPIRLPVGDGRSGGLCRPAAARAPWHCAAVLNARPLEGQAD